MNAVTLHYIHDPFCGWCYGAAPLVKAASAVLPVQARGGGMMAGSRRQPVTQQLRDYVMPHDRRIADLTGQPFGEPYFEGLLRDASAVFDSAPPIAAMLAADKIAGRGLDLLARMQVAHYVEGRRIADRDVLIEMAAAIGLDATAFAQALEEAGGEEVQLHIAETRALMARIGARGFPSFAFERGGQFTLIDAGAFLGRPDALQAWLRAQFPDEAALRAGTAADFGCGPDGCSI
ncbi:DsbA family protein [Herbaspirillum sp. HC18]|nr:DsbA family protein [Herbaspirillum sp. HC18]